MYNANNVAGNTFYGYKNDNHNVFAEQTDALDEILTPEQKSEREVCKESQEVLAIGYDLDYHRQHKLEMQES